MIKARVVGATLMAMAILVAAFAASAAGAQAKRETQYPVSVTLAGTGSGKVTSTGTVFSGQQISCPGNCSTMFWAGSVVTIAATPAPGSVFAGFTGSHLCAGVQSPCAFEIHEYAQITAVFNVAPPNDMDGDGILDADDGCPTQPGRADNRGCPRGTTPPPTEAEKACDKARQKLEHAQHELNKLLDGGIDDKRLDTARRKVRAARGGVKKACPS